MTARDTDIMLQRLQAMQRAKLKQNGHKGGWRGDDLAALLFRLYEEADELKAEVLRLLQMQRFGAKALQPKQTLAVMHEAADVANFAGFIVDKLWASRAVHLTTGEEECNECGGIYDAKHDWCSTCDKKLRLTTKQAKALASAAGCNIGNLVAGVVITDA